MACARPAIVSDRVGCGPDLVESGVTGLIYPYADVQALAHCMIQMVEDPAAARRMGEAARERLFGGYSVEAAVAGTLAAVRSLSQGGDPLDRWSEQGSAE